MAEQKVQFTVSAQDDASAVLRKVADQLDKT